MTLVCKNPDCANDVPARFMGHEVPGVYDGVLFWVCLECGLAFPRDFGPVPRSIVSQEYATDYNRRGESDERAGHPVQG